MLKAGIKLKKPRLAKNMKAKSRIFAKRSNGLITNLSSKRLIKRLTYQKSTNKLNVAKG